MSRITKYGNLSDDELLRYVADARQYSPIIEELCQRIENEGDPEGQQGEVDCPVCEALLIVNDTGTGSFDLEAKE